MGDVTINTGAILEALNNKTDTDLANVAPPVDFVVKTGQSDDGLSWYREYKSGWIEQGGTSTALTLTFPVPFLNTNYTLTALPIMMSTNMGANDVNYYAKTTTDIMLQLRFNGGAQSGFAYMWMAAGFKGPTT